MRVALLSCWLVAAAVGLSAPQSRAAAIWNFAVCNGSTTQPGSVGGNQNGVTLGNSFDCAATGSTNRDLSLTAWGSQNDGTFGAAFVSKQGSDGFGVGSASEGGELATSPGDALDNDPTSLAPNLFLLSFDAAVMLDRVTLGWSFNDADLTVMAYTGALAPAALLTGQTASTLVAGGAGAGWALIENVGDADASVATATAASGSDVSYAVNAGKVSSRLWLIGAYSPGYGAGSMDSLVDYGRLLSVTTGDATVDATVDEPVGLALVGLGLGVAWAARWNVLCRRRDDDPMRARRTG